MSIVSLKEILPDAKSKKYAVPHINVNGILWAKSMLLVAEEMKSPFILAVSDRMIDYLGGFKTVQSLIVNLYKQLNNTIPIAIHLDHGRTVERCLEAIEAGFTSVMYDGSVLPIDENIKNTKIVVSAARKKGISVEAEVGSIGGTEDGITGGIKYATLIDCKNMQDYSGIDAIAAALGSVHGTYLDEPNLNFERMQEISNNLNIPLVLHGASGISYEDIRKAINYGHAKINFNTELNLVWVSALRKSLADNPCAREPSIINAPVMKEMKEKIKQIILLLGSSNKV